MSLFRETLRAVRSDPSSFSQRRVEDIQLQKLDFTASSCTGLPQIVPFLDVLLTDHPFVLLLNAIEAFSLIFLLWSFLWFTTETHDYCCLSGGVPLLVPPPSPQTAVVLLWQAVGNLCLWCGDWGGFLQFKQHSVRLPSLPLRSAACQVQEKLSWGSLFPSSLLIWGYPGMLGPLVGGCPTACVQSSSGLVTNDGFWWHSNQRRVWVQIVGRTPENWSSESPWCRLAKSAQLFLTTVVVERITWYFKVCCDVMRYGCVFGPITLTLKTCRVCDLLLMHLSELLCFYLITLVLS